MTTFIGIDISEQRGCAIAGLDESGHSVGTVWSRSNAEDVLRGVRALAPTSHDLVIGIDSPRYPVNIPRKWYWDKKSADWRPRLPKERGWGRHCEVIVAALKLANPQWARPESDAPAWMRLGFQLFATLQPIGQIHEVFPTACYAQLADVKSLRVEVAIAAFAEGPKDMLDAYVGALTVCEFANGRGTSIGGGDDLGAIVLPRPVPVSAGARLLQWPATSYAA